MNIEIKINTFEGRCPICAEYVYAHIKTGKNIIHRCRRAVKGDQLLKDPKLLKFLEGVIRVDIDVIRSYIYLSSKYAN